MNTPALNRRNFLKLGSTAAGALALSTTHMSTHTAQAAPASTAPKQVTPDAVMAAIAKLDTMAADEIKANAVPGMAIAVVYQDQVVFAKAYGVKDASKSDAANAIDPDTVFQLASVSKPIGATLLARLVGEGAISWDTRLSDLDPSFAMYEPWVTREVTIRDMYSHRSGLPEYSGDLLEDLDFSREEILRRLRFQPPSSSFRSSYAYSNFGMTAGAVSVAKALGATWETLMEQKLYSPLGMKNTSSRFADFEARKNRALGHVRDGDKWVAKFKRNADTESPAGGVSSSLNDMTKWVRLQLSNGKFEGKQIVDESALTQTHQPQIVVGYNSEGLPGFYGLGWNVDYHAQGKLRLSHSGAFALGTGTSVYLVPDQSLGVIALTNALPTGVAEAMCASFLDLAMEGKLRQDWLSAYKDAYAKMIAALSTSATYSKPPEKLVPALPNAAYIGTYANDYFGEIYIVEVKKDGSLQIQQGPNKKAFAMTHFQRDVFTYVTEGESATGVAGISFAVGPDDKATRVWVENLDKNGLGTFTRTALKSS
jgi:CubicO group peptidase (beta-lactamase class C family)